MTIGLRNGKVALVTGAAGQDGVYLSQFLLAKGYIVYGLYRGDPPRRGDRTESLLRGARGRYMAKSGDVTDAKWLRDTVRDARPDEVYNLAAQSSVQASFSNPSHTFAVNTAGTENLIRAIQSLAAPNFTRLFQASSSEMFGDADGALADERTPFAPQSPYAQSKCRAHDSVVRARERDGLHGCNGILFNHESPLRDESFATRKISKSVALIRSGGLNKLTLGNLDAIRDWGHAREFVTGMWLMLQRDKADDYVLATGVAGSIRDFVAASFARVGIRIEWFGEGLDEKGICAATGAVLVDVDSRFYRSATVGAPIGNPAKARSLLSWSAKTTWRELCVEMVDADVALIS